MDKYLIKGKENSMNKFVQDLTEQEFFGENFPQEEISALHDPKKVLQPNVKFDRKRAVQTETTSSSTKLNAAETSKKRAKFDYLPVPKSVLNQTSFKSKDKAEDGRKEKNAPNKQPLRRQPCLITGTVEFIIKIHKANPEIEFICEVYGKLINIVKGKYPFEKLIFLRGSVGPVLQGVFYEIDYNITFLQAGQNICCVGRFRSNNKLHLFKIKSVPALPSDEALIRLQNISSFTFNKIN